MPKGLIVLSNAGVEAILNEAMSHKFQYIQKPNDINNFYYLVNFTIRI